MATSYRTHAKSDTFVDEGSPTKNFGSLGVLRTDNTSGHRKWALMHIPMPSKFKKDYVLKATLTLHINGTLSGVTFTAKRITSHWSENKIFWNDKPSTTTTNQATGVLVSGDKVTFDVTNMMNDVANGGSYYGIQITSDASARHGITSSEGDRAKRPELFIKYAHQPDPPVKLAPSGVQLYDPLPRVSWHLPKTDKGVTQTYSRVQVFANPVNLATPLYDSGKWANTTHSFDLSTDTTGATGALNTPYVGVSAGAAVSFRVMFWDEAGAASDWSALASFSYNTAGTVTITAPVDNSDVIDTTPTISWTWTPGSNGNAPTHVRYVLDQVGVQDLTSLASIPEAFSIVGGHPPPYLPIHLQDTGWQVFDGSSFEFTPDKGKISTYNTQYQVTIYVNDGLDTGANHRNVSDVNVPSAAVHFYLGFSDVIWPPYNVEIEQFGPGFRLDWDSDLQDTPDWWVITVDDEVVSEHIDGDEPFVEFYDNPDLSIAFLDDVDLNGLADGLQFVGSPATYSVMPGTPPALEDEHGQHFTTTSGTAAGFILGDPVAVKDRLQLITATTGLWVDSLGGGCLLTQYLKFYAGDGTLLTTVSTDVSTVNAPGSDAQTIVTSAAAPPGTATVKVQWSLHGGTGGSATIAKTVVSDTVGHYSWTLYGLRPWQQHSVQIACKLDGQGMSDQSEAVEAEWEPKGIWLTETSQNLWVQILGVQDVQQTLSRDGGTFFLINRPDPVRIEAKPRGFFGSVTGTIISDTGGAQYAHSADEKIAILERIVGQWSTSPTLHLTFGHDSFPVTIADYQKRQWPVADGEPGVYDVQFNWWQTGQFSIPGAVG